LGQGTAGVGLVGGVSVQREPLGLELGRVRVPLPPQRRRRRCLGRRLLVGFGHGWDHGVGFGRLAAAVAVRAARPVA
jgi:hypothetical protein